MHYNHMTTKFLSLASLAGVFFMNACSPGEEQTGTGYPQAFDVSNLDTSMAPCQDFDNFANGTWKTNNHILASERRWGSFNILKNGRVQFCTPGTNAHAELRPM